MRHGQHRQPPSTSPCCRPNADWAQWLDWLRRKSPLVTPSPFKPAVKRDLDDGVVLAAALGGRTRSLCYCGGMLCLPELLHGSGEFTTRPLL